jgi:hypothetical protein
MSTIVNNSNNVNGNGNDYEVEFQTKHKNTHILDQYISFCLG